MAKPKRENQEKEVLLKELVVTMLNGEDNPDCEYLAFMFNEINQQVSTSEPD